MQKLRALIDHRPLLFCMAIILISVVLLLILKIYVGEPEPLFNWPRLFLLNAISSIVIVLLFKFGWQRKSGFTNEPSQWHPNWYIAMLPMLALALLSLLSIDWSVIEFSSIRVVAWLIANLSTGLFEEMLLRGFCFYILLRLWGSSIKGVLLAAFVQALMFGLAHLGNLFQMPPLDVIAQTLYATLIGFGFAGLVYYSRSVWPAIVVHTTINSLGSANEYLNPNFIANESPGLIGYAIIICIFAIASVLPGYILIKKSFKHYSMQAYQFKG